MILFLALAISGCGGGGEAPAEPAEGESLTTGMPDPPPQESIGIGGGSSTTGPHISVGNNNLSSSTDVGEWQVPPTMFGAMADFAWALNGVNQTNLTTVTLTSGADSNLTLTISKNTLGNVEYGVSDSSTTPPTPHTVTAYTPGTDKDCSMMGAGIAKFTTTGTKFTGNHTFNGTVSIGYKVTPATDTGCH